MQPNKSTHKHFITSQPVKLPTRERGVGGRGGGGEGIREANGPRDEERDESRRKKMPKW